MPKPPIDTVHVIFKTHLDVGFTDFARNVKRNYLERFIPAALMLAKQLYDTPNRFVWTTGSWIIYEYLEWASPANRRFMEEAIARGDIAWHAMPFTTHSEYMGREMFRFGLSLSRELDRRFGRQTIAAKMTDVPGHTRAIVPLLVEAGVKFLHIGVNPACRVPDVPATFTWRDPTSGAEVLMMYDADYGKATLVPGTRDAIHFAHTGDNLGPQWCEDVVNLYGRLRNEYPGAVVQASTLDAYAGQLIAARPVLPVVTAEIGDSWIYGTGSDPAKTAAYRAACRVYDSWLAEGKVKADDKKVTAANRPLMMVAEHTWGMDVKTHLHEWKSYSPEALTANRKHWNFVHLENSWREQREYIEQALQALDGQPLAAAMRNAIAATQPCRITTIDMQKVKPTVAIDIGRFRVKVGSTGAIVNLQDTKTGRTLATPKHPLGLVTYEMFSSADYRRYLRQYARDLPQHKAWAVPDLTKPGMDKASGGHFEVHPRLAGLWKYVDHDLTTVVAKLLMPTTIVRKFGAPRELWLTLIGQDEEPALSIDLQWFGKQATRLPEAMWLSFQPKLAEPKGWKLDKLGQYIAPDEAVSGGGRHLHAVWSGIRYQGSDGQLEIQALDAPLVAPGRRTLLHCDKKPIRLAGGMHFNLYNNLYGTNFAMWYEQDARFRFRVMVL
jgi:Domain of unknown function (DUF5054)